MTTTGRCLCGSVRYEIRGEPKAMIHCHCSQCRRSSGASYTTSLLVAPDDLRIVSGDDSIREFESSPGKWRRFCGTCGSPLYKRIEGSPFWPVRAGTLDGDPGVRPSVHIYVGSKAPWVDVTDGLPCNEKGLVG